ncbi:MAG: Do family serine endopeptidase [Pseudomonadota bacterium]
MISPRLANRLTSAALAGALVTTSLVSLAPSAAQAVPAGGYADLLETLTPSVVFIEVEGTRSASGPAWELPEDMPEELRNRLERMMPELRRAPEQERRGVGSGFIISEDGMIVTNSHVVDGADRVTVTLTDDRSFDAEVIGSDPLTDIALLKVEADEALPPVPFGASDAMRVGDEVIAVGNPFGLGGTVTTGIVSALSRNINAGPYDDFIQTDAAINRGNSGGPLFNAEGEVIGVNTAIFSRSGGSVGIGFAVPSDLAQDVIADLADDGEITRGWLGVQIRPMTEEVADLLGYEAPRGAVVERVVDDSPAEAAGLREGDIILSFDGTEISDLRDLTRAVADTDPEAEVPVEIFRGGAARTVSVTVGLLEPADA